MSVKRERDIELFKTIIIKVNRSLDAAINLSLVTFYFMVNGQPNSRKVNTRMTNFQPSKKLSFASLVINQ